MAAVKTLFRSEYQDTLNQSGNKGIFKARGENMQQSRLGDRAQEIWLHVTVMYAKYDMPNDSA